MSACPLLKYPGSKRTLVPALRKIIERVASDTRCLVIPFGGSCADAIGLSDRFEQVVVADNNADLVGFYQAVAADPGRTWDEVSACFTETSTTDEDVFLALRDWVRSLPPGNRERSVMLPYFSQSVFNGVLRYSADGRLNSACGLARQKPRCPTLAEFHAFAEWARDVELLCQDFRQTMATAGDGDLVILDPPYVKEDGKKTAFTGYSPAGPFSATDQRDLVEEIHAAQARGATLLVFNHDTQKSRALYAGADEIAELQVARSVNRDGKGRTPAAELLAVFMPVKAAADYQKTEQPRGAVVGFFAGMGGLDLGFERAGFRTWLAVDANQHFADGYVYARQRMGVALPVQGVNVRSVENFLTGEDADRLRRIVAEARAAVGSVGFIGGPPCPDFSIAGKQAGADGDNGRLARVYVDLIVAQRPDWFLFENVKGLVSTAQHRAHFDELKGVLGAGGYRLAEKLVDAVQYGVPQRRERILLVGFLEGGAVDAETSAAAIDFDRFATWPGRTALDLPWPKMETFALDVIRPWPAELPEAAKSLTPVFWFERNRVDEHPDGGRAFVPKSVRIAEVDEGDDSRKSFKRLHRYRPSPTAAYGKNEVHLHPWLARRLSVAEALAVQSMPADFALPPDMSLTDCFKTVGNAVPFLLALGAAQTVAAALDAGAAVTGDPTVPAAPNVDTPRLFADLCSGAGGMSAGFTRRGWKCVGAVDYEVMAAGANDTYEANIGVRPVNADLFEYGPEEFREHVCETMGIDLAPGVLDVLSACMPCTDFSRVRAENLVVDGERNQLIGRVGNWAETLLPKIIVMENVRELLSGPHRHHFDSLRQRLVSLGYDVSTGVHRLDRFGLPQIRERALVVASRVGSARDLADVWDGFSIASAATTLRTALARMSANIPADDPMSVTPGLTDDVRRRMDAIPRDGGSWAALTESPSLRELMIPSMRRKWESGSISSYTDAYGRMAWDRPAPTIKRQCGHFGSGRYAHPDETRLLTVREMAVVQGFPYDWQFAGAMTNQYRQIGNAVPPMISWQIAALVEWLLGGRKPTAEELVMPGTSMRVGDIVPGRQEEHDPQEKLAA